MNEAFSTPQLLWLCGLNNKSHGPTLQRPADPREDCRGEPDYKAVPEEREKKIHLTASECQNTGLSHTPPDFSGQLFSHL